MRGTEQEMDGILGGPDWRGATSKWHIQAHDRRDVGPQGPAHWPRRPADIGGFCASVYNAQEGGQRHFAVPATSVVSAPPELDRVTPGRSLLRRVPFRACSAAAGGAVPGAGALPRPACAAGLSVSRRVAERSAPPWQIPATAREMQWRSSSRRVEAYREEFDRPTGTKRIVPNNPEGNDGWTGKLNNFTGPRHFNPQNTSVNPTDGNSYFVERKMGTKKAVRPLNPKSETRSPKIPTRLIRFGSGAALVGVACMAALLAVRFRPDTSLCLLTVLVVIPVSFSAAHRRAW